MDFEDLQLAARDLLAHDESVRTRSAFRLVTVDEFQDTNRLQCEIVDLTAHQEATEVFTVGDEFQSIYGFRHADVEVFRERRDQAENLLTLRSNYRSRPQVLAAVNYLFARVRRGVPAARRVGRVRGPVFGHPVELLVTDKGSYRDGPEHWRRARRRSPRGLVSWSTPARRCRVRSWSSLPPEPTRSATKKALRREGSDLPRDGSRLLRPAAGRRPPRVPRLLHNRYDDVALVTVLASPFVGVSNDALVLLRRGAPRRLLFSALERGLPPGLSAADGRLLRAFLQRYERLVHVRPDRPRAALRPRPGRARLRPGRAGAVGRVTAVRQSPQARAPPAGVRGDPRRRPRRLRPLRREQEALGAPGARGRRGGGGRGRGAAPRRSTARRVSSSRS